ncbi:MAG: hypothetical protein WCF68_15290 [Terriglobales bacterium]
MNQVAYCSHPEASASACEGGIVRAHTLQLAGSLSTIAVSRHVYGFDALSQPESDGTPRYRLIGVRRASTFTGFCSRHDTELFRPLEDRPFATSKEQLFLLAYRALSKEVYAKRFAVRSVPILRRGDKGRDTLFQVGLQKYLYIHEQVLRLALRDLESSWRDYQHAFLSCDYDRFSAYLVFTDKIPDFAVSGAIHPEFDFQGNAIQNLATPDRLDLVTYTVLPLCTSGLIAFVWDSGSASSCQKLAASLDSLPSAEIPDALVRFTYEYFENCYANPQWWERLSEEERTSLLRRMALAASDQVARRADCLKDDGLRTANWRVLKREWL